MKAQCRKDIVATMLWRSLNKKGQSHHYGQQKGEANKRWGDKGLGKKEKYKRGQEKNGEEMNGRRQE